MRFFLNISHEFRTPLSTIFSSANIIDRYPNSDQYENRAVHTKKIKKSVTMLINILDEFLNLTKLEKDVVVIRKESEAYSLSTFCHSTIVSFPSKRQNCWMTQCRKCILFWSNSTFSLRPSPQRGPQFDTSASNRPIVSPV